MSRSGADLALLLLGGYRKLVDAAIQELSARGYQDFRPVHDFAMRSIASGADSASDLGRRMSVTKQAAAKTIAVLIQRGYITRTDDPSDARRKRLEVTDLGWEVMHEGEAIFNQLRSDWEAAVGRDGLAALEAQLDEFVGDSHVRPDDPGWVSHGLG